MNEKVPPTASNRRKRELAREGDLVTYKRKRKTIDPNTVVPPNTVDSANEGVSKPLPPTESAQAALGVQAESAQAVNIPQGLEFETESAQAALGAQALLPNVSPNYDVSIPIVGGYSEGEGTTSNDDVGPSDKSLLWSFRFHRARSIAPEQDLIAFKSLKAGGAGNSLSLRKLKEYYAYKLEKVLSDGTAAAAKKKKGLTTRSVACAYMLYVLGSFLFPTKKRTNVSARYLYLFAKDKVAKKWSWGSAVLAHMYYNLGTTSRDDGRQFAYCTTLLEIFVHFPKLAGIPKEMDSDAYEHCTYWKWDVSVTDRYGSTTLLKFRKALDNYKLEDEIELKRVVEEQCVLEFVNLPRQLDAKILEYKNLEEKNTSLEAEPRQKSVLEDCNQSLSAELNKKCKESESLKSANALLMEQIDLQLPLATPLVVLQSHQPVPNTTLAKKYEDMLAAHKDVKKKLIAIFFHNIPVNSEERKKTLEVDNSEWEVWRQVLKKALASEGMGDMGDPTFEELFEQNERFFTIVQQGPNGDYQENLVSTVVTLENIVIARREKMAKKKKIQELLFQPWTKYLVDVRGVEIRPHILEEYLQPTLGIQFTPDGENAYQILLQACSYRHQDVEYWYMTHLLSTYYEKVVVFISHTEAYTFLPLFWACKRNTTSNEERFQNHLMDTSKYWWSGLGVNNHYVRLFPRFDAPIPLVSIIFYNHVNLEIPLAFLKEQMTRYFDLRVRNFKALLRKHNVKGYRVNDMVVVGLSTIK
ncbi:hypothetical protein GIB67_019041 [Kingdonia uniflora]|uniref:Aminotransferase-like plant mobile domain-containing protein n=1 Tax=Kingdonia uniflora TaxID=39325 RepID=A0A7J7MZV4_9MAGN|nr:hypothetical protein GIB67_019041 [Kingdonia uniflora]